MNGMKFLLVLVTVLTVSAQQAAPKKGGGNQIPPEHGDDVRGYNDTPQLPNQPWKVHDMNRPRAVKVTPDAEFAVSTAMATGTSRTGTWIGAPTPAAFKLAAVLVRARMEETACQLVDGTKLPKATVVRLATVPGSGASLAPKSSRG